MNILFLSRFLPHKKIRDGGGQNKFHYIKALNQAHKITLVTYTSPNSQFSKKHSSSALENICNVIQVPQKPKTLAYRLKNLIWRLLKTRVYGRVFSKEYKNQLILLLKKNKFDVVIVDGQMAAYIPMLRQITHILLYEVDIYSKVAHDLYKQESKSLGKLYLWFDWKRTLYAEFMYGELCDGILVYSKADQLFLQSQIKDAKYMILTPWFEGLDNLKTIDNKKPVSNDILFVGAMQNPKNINAVIWFAKQVLPLIKIHVPDVTFTIVGANPTKQVKDLSSQAIRVTGEVPELLSYYQQASVAIAPLMVSGGIILKTLNAFASARPIVATSQGNSGTNAQDKIHLIISKLSPQDFAQATIYLLKDEAAWTYYSTNGRKFILENYNWEAVLTDFNNFFASLEAIKSPN